MHPGDYIDDYCSRCKRVSDHAVVSMVGESVAKVRCRTCNNEHNYRHSEIPKRHIQDPMKGARVNPTAASTERKE